MRTTRATAFAHVGHGDDVSGVMRGLWHAHVGWLLDRQARPACVATPRPLRGPGHAINRNFPGSCCSPLLPALLGFLVSGTLAGAATGLSGAASCASSSSIT